MALGLKKPNIYKHLNFFRAKRPIFLEGKTHTPLRWETTEPSANSAKVMDGLKQLVGLGEAGAWRFGGRWLEV